MQYIGVTDKSLPYTNYNKGLEDRYPPVVMEKISYNSDPAMIAETSKYRIYQVRWPVFTGVSGEGILLQPKISPAGNVIALPDADQTPEQLAGLAPGVQAESQFPRHLAENGFQVLIPVLINRNYLFPGTTQQFPYRLSEDLSINIPSCGIQSGLGKMCAPIGLFHAINYFIRVLK